MCVACSTTSESGERRFCCTTFSSIGSLSTIYEEYCVRQARPDVSVVSREIGGRARGGVVRVSAMSKLFGVVFLPAPCYNSTGLPIFVTWCILRTLRRRLCLSWDAQASTGISMQ